MLKKHERFHKLGPADLNWDEKPLTEVLVQRQTSMTGETISISVPVYAADTREVLNDRMGLFFSIMQDRMEDENERVMELEKQIQDKVKAAEDVKAARHLAEAEAKREKKADKKTAKEARTQ